jgi:superfamily I DNA/RNA helicase
MIYGEGLSWRSCGLNVQAVERFADNYRNTAEIARLAIAMSEMPHMAGDKDDLVVPRQPVAGGPKPTLAECRDEAQEIAIVKRQAADLARNGTVAVLARTWADARRACAGLTTRRLHKDMARWEVEPGVYCGAYHSAKGLEFDAVIMPFCGRQHMPPHDKIAAYGEAGAMSREGRLLYVAITRARTDLLITYSGDITPLLPTGDGLYARVAP